MWTTQISILLSVLHASAASSPLCEAQTSGCSVDDTNLLQKSDPGRNSVNKPLTEDTNALSLSQQHQTGEQSARALDDMNKRYENMLREVVAGGPKELPTDSMLDPIINQFTVFKAELVGQQAHHQSLVEAALGDVNACNTNKATAFDESGTGVTDLETAMSSARTSHSLCRASETTAGADAAASCKLFEDQQASSCQAAAAWVPSNLASAGLLATDCVAKQAALTQSSSTCDTDQAQFELDFCAWSSRLKIVCSNLQACRGEALAERTLIVEEVEELESSHKRMHVAYEKALCFLNLLKTAKSANLTSTHIDSCTDLSPDTSALTVTYPNAPSAVTCSTVAVTHQPGDAEWRTAEYVNLAAAQLEPTVACPAAPTPAASYNPELPGDFSTWTMVGVGLSCTDGCTGMGMTCDTGVTNEGYAGLQSKFTNHTADVQTLADVQTVYENGGGQTTQKVEGYSCRTRGMEPHMYYWEPQGNYGPYVIPRCVNHANHPSNCDHTPGDYDWPEAHVPLVKRLCPCKAA